MSASKFQNIPDELRQRNNFLCWKYEQRDGETKPRKVPHYAGGGKRKGIQGSDIDRANLASFADAIARHERGGVDGIGLAMLPNDGITCLDLDDCFDEAGALHPDVAPLVEGTYAERSPSGRGLRIIFRGSLPDKKSLGPEWAFGFETFCNKGYVTLTGDKLPDAASAIAPLSDFVREYASRRFKDSANLPSLAKTSVGREILTAVTPEQYATLCSALDYGPMRDAMGDEPFCSEVGLSLRSLGSVGEQLWLEATAKAADHSNQPDPTWRLTWWDRHGSMPKASDWRHILLMARKLGWGASADLDDFDLVAAAPKLHRVPFRFESTPANIATRTLPEREWVIYPYLAQLTVGLLLSVGGFGKSHVLLLMAICKALGLPNFCGRECTPGRVVILTAEDDLDEIWRRMQRLLRELIKHGTKIDYAMLRENLHVVDLTGGGIANWLTCADRQGASPTEMVEHIVQQVGRADLIALDTQSRFAGASENDNAAAAVFIGACETIAKRCEACVLVLAHTGKSVAREGIVDQYVSQGASAFSDNARNVMVLAAPSTEDLKRFDIDEREVHEGKKFRLVHVKTNYTSKAKDLHFERLENGVILPYLPVPKEQTSEDELAVKLLGWIGQGEIRLSELDAKYRDIFGDSLTRKKARGVFERCKREGRLRFERTKNQADFYKVSASARVAIDAPMQLSSPIGEQDWAKIRAELAGQPAADLV